jgi:hypothetical protein
MDHTRYIRNANPDGPRTLLGQKASIEGYATALHTIIGEHEQQQAAAHLADLRRARDAGDDMTRWLPEAVVQAADAGMDLDAIAEQLGCPLAEVADIVVTHAHYAWHVDVLNGDTWTRTTAGDDIAQDARALAKSVLQEYVDEHRERTGHGPDGMLVFVELYTTGAAQADAAYRDGQFRSPPPGQ